MTATEKSSGEVAGVTLWRLDPAGVGIAIAIYCLALTPSLLPRPWYLQGVISGILTATGYAVGVLGAYLARPLLRRRSRRVRRRTVWLFVLGIGGVLAAFYSSQGAAAQRDLYALMGTQPPPAYVYLGVPPLAAGIFVLTLAVARLLRAGARALGRILGRWIPLEAARILAAIFVLLLFFGLLQGIVTDVLLRGANNAFKTINGETDPGTQPPLAPDLSGGPGSLVSWGSLGRRGREFVAGGPTLDDLGRLNGRTPTQPIRVYVGLDSAASPRVRAALAVRELERTGAFAREVLCVITTTGEGWIDPSAVGPLEYMYNGDSALVALQYSYLPSWMSFLVDRDRARATGRELFDQVFDRWSELPDDHRPKLLVFGESLGAFGAEAAFSGVDDIRNRTDGMLLVGPPNSSPLWSEFVSERDPGTDEVLPIYEDGTTVRFAGRPADLSAPPSRWDFPRVVYLQHASDPVVWWSPRLALNRPAWLTEKRGRDVLPSMRWYPFVTFWQLTADLVYSLDVPPGHGHDYGTEEVDAWAEIAPPAGWTDQDTARLKALIGRTSP